MITAKVRCVDKGVDQGHGDSRQCNLVFGADYMDGRNKEWSVYTPALSLTMAVKGSVADRFEVGRTYTLTFEDTTEADAGVPPEISGG